MFLVLDQSINTGFSHLFFFLSLLFDIVGQLQVFHSEINIYILAIMGCVSSSKSTQDKAPAKTTTTAPPNRAPTDTKPSVNTKAYVSPPSIIEAQTNTIQRTNVEIKPIQKRPAQNLRPKAMADDGGYPDMNNYSNAKENYLNAASRQTTDILKDEDYGYYAANGRNISMRVDINN